MRRVRPTSKLKKPRPAEFSVLWRTPVLAGMRLPIGLTFPDDVKDVRGPLMETREPPGWPSENPTTQIPPFYTTMVHTGVMTSRDKTVRQSVTLPAKVATQVRSMAKRRRLSANRMLVELLEEGIEAKKQKEKAFFELAEHFRAATDPKEVERLGEELGQMVFGR